MTVIINGTTGITNVNGSAAAPAETGTDTDTGIVYGTNTITLATGGTAGLVQDASQNIGVGLTPSIWSTGKVVEAGYVGTALWGYAANEAYMTMNLYYNSGWKYASTNAASYYNQYNGSHYFGSYPSGTIGAAATPTTTLAWGRNTTVALQGASSGIAGTGITFPASQNASSDANTLDDYEEGSWTPGSATSGLSVSAVSSASYTKIGRQVTCYCYITLNNTSGSAKATYILNGLPFVANVGYGFIREYYSGSSTVANGDQYVESGSASFNVNGANLPTGTSLHMYYLSYFV